MKPISAIRSLSSTKIHHHEFPKFCKPCDLFDLQGKASKCLYHPSFQIVFHLLHKLKLEDLMLFNRSEVDTKFNHNFFPVPEASPTNATFSKCTSLNEHVIHADQSECNFVNRGETCQSGRMGTNHFF